MSAEEPLFSEAGELVVQLMQQSASDLAFTTNALVDSLTHQRDTANATLEAIRMRMDALLLKPYAPSSSALEAAMWPSEAEVDYYRKKAQM